MDDQRRAAASIIHSHAITASGLAAMMAQIAILNIGVSTALLSNMFSKLTRTMRPDSDDLDEMTNAIVSLILSWLATSFIARSVVGLVPVVGNIANGAMTFATFEAVGWGIFELLRTGRDPRTVTKEEFGQMVEAGKAQKLDTKAALKRMPKRVKAEYDEVVNQLKNSELSEADQAALQDKLSGILNPYLD